MALPLIYRRRVLAAAIESTLGTLETLTSANCGFRVYDRDLRLIRATNPREREGGLGHDTGEAGAASTELTLTTKLVGKGTNTTFLQGTLLRACGLLEATATYSGTSLGSNFASISAGLYKDGNLLQGRGMMGNAVFSCKAGEPVEVKWDFKGGAVDTGKSGTNATMLTGITYEGAPALFSNAGTNALIISGTNTFKISSWELDLGNTVGLREDAQQFGGYLCGWIDNRLPTLKLDPEAMDWALWNWHAKQSANTEMSASIQVGSAAGNIFTFNFGSLQVQGAPTDRDRDGKIAEDVVLQVNQDNFSIVAT